MTRIKVINDTPDLIAVFRAVDTQVKKDVFKEAGEKWVTAEEMVDKYGEEGKEALIYFEKTKLVKTRWQADPETREPTKAYKTFYKSVHINVQSPIHEISEVLSVALMPQEEFREIENKILDMLEDNGVYVGDLLEELDMEQIVLKSIIRRSAKLIYKGHRIERFGG